MSIVFAVTQESSMSTLARSLRISLQLTQQELANMADVSKEDIDLLEHNLPIPQYIKNKLFKKLYAVKSAGKYQLCLPL